jgi:hypothetical protein
MTGSPRVRVGIADHFGWAVAVSSSDAFDVLDRRRIALVEPDVTDAPIHYESKHLDVAATTELVAEWRASVQRATARALDELADAVPTPIESVSLRALPSTFPDDVETMMRTPYEARADAVMYRQILVELVEQRGWTVHFYEAKSVLAQAAAVLGDRTDDVIDGPRARLGAPWTKDHRVALAATVVAG